MDIAMGQNDLTNINNVVYQKLIDNITTLWGEAKSKAITAVNTELLDANWQTGKYIVEYELKGKDRADLQEFIDVITVKLNEEQGLFSSEDLEEA